MDKVELRRAGHADAAVIRELTRAAYAKWVAVIGREPAPMQADYEAAVRKHRFDLLYVEGVLVGLIETVDQGERLMIENVAVAPAFQGRGLGSRLMAHAEDMARASDHGRVSLYTNKRFEENLRLYLRLGYEVSGETDVGGGIIRVNMDKILRPPADVRADP